MFTALAFMGVNIDFNISKTAQIKEESSRQLDTTHIVNMPIYKVINNSLTLFFNEQFANHILSFYHPVLVVSH